VGVGGGAAVAGQGGRGGVVAGGAGVWQAWWWHPGEGGNQVVAGGTHLLFQMYSRVTAVCGEACGIEDQRSDEQREELRGRHEQATM